MSVIIGVGMYVGAGRLDMTGWNYCVVEKHKYLVASYSARMEVTMCMPGR